MVKTCTRCHESKPLTEFNKNSRPTTDGYNYWCRPCVKSYNADRKAAKAAPVSDTTLLTCSTCQRAQPATAFHRNKAMLTGRMNQCKACCTDYYESNAQEKKQKQREYYRKDPAKHNAHWKDWARKNRSIVRGYGAKRRAAKYGISVEGQLTQEQWLEILKQANWQCHYCKRDIFQPTARSSALDATQDHIIPLINNGQHTAENIVPACRRCNSLKHDWSYEAFLDRIKTDPDIFKTSEEALPSPVLPS